MLAHYQNLAEDLFNAVFVSIWSDQLTEHQQVGPNSQVCTYYWKQELLRFII